MHIDPSTPEAFCASLKAARQRRGIALETISTATKVAVSQYVALERGHLRHWPTGLFRRAYFRDYVEAIGLPVSETVEAFLRLFPEDGKAPAAEQRLEAEPLRLTIEPRRAPADLTRRVLTAAGDAAVVLAVAGVAAFVSPATFSQAAVALAIPYYSLRMMRAGTAAWHLGSSTADQAQMESPAPEPQPAVLEHRSRRWVPDARRVRRVTPDAARLRVRIKLVR